MLSRLATLGNNSQLVLVFQRRRNFFEEVEPGQSKLIRDFVECQHGSVRLHDVAAGDVTQTPLQRRVALVGMPREGRPLLVCIGGDLAERFVARYR